MSILFTSLLRVSFFSTVYQRMEEGGITSMSILMLLLMLCIAMIIKGIIHFKKGSLPTDKNSRLINSIGLLALIIGVFSQLLGLISALDHFHFLEGASPSVLAGGLKTTFLPTLLGTFIFIIARIATTIFIWLTKERQEEGV